MPGKSLQYDLEQPATLSSPVYSDLHERQARNVQTLGRYLRSAWAVVCQLIDVVVSGLWRSVLPQPLIVFGGRMSVYLVCPLDISAFRRGSHTSPSI